MFKEGTCIIVLCSMKVDRSKPTTEGRHWEAAYASSVLVELPTKIMQNI